MRDIGALPLLSLIKAIEFCFTLFYQVKSLTHLIVALISFALL